MLCFFIIADLHTLTTKPEKENIEQLSEKYSFGGARLSVSGHRSRKYR
jgi:hypothetical protein